MKRLAEDLLILRIGLGLSLFVGCGADQVCAPGQQEACACPGSEVGAQACNAEGSGFEECVCEPVAAGGGDSGGGVPAGGGPPTGPGQPPPPEDDAPVADGSDPRVFGVTHLYIGLKTFEGSTGADAWKGFGYDIDAQVTIDDFSAHCRPNGGAASASVFPDAPDGVDNSFGRAILPILKTAFASTSPDLEEELNLVIGNGDRTLLFDLSALGPGASYSAVASSFFEGKARTGTTWLKSPEFFDGDQPRLMFPDAYLTDNVWVSRRVDGVLTVNLDMGYPIPLAIHRPLVTAELSPDHQAVTRGLISGVLDTAQFVEAMRTVLESADERFCNGATIQGILNQFRGASDIMKDGSQVSTATCNGISIGLGFTAEAVALGGFAAPETPAPDPCD